MASVVENQQRFDEAFRIADEARARTIALLRRVSQADSGRRPEPSAWSLGEIAHHLILTDLRTVYTIHASYAEGKLDEFTPEQVKTARPFPLADTGDVAKTGKGTAPAFAVPTPGQSVNSLLGRLEQIRTLMKAELARLRDHDLGRLFVVHQRFGPLSLYDRIAFTAYHEQKHAAQMARTAERLGITL